MRIGVPKEIKVHENRVGLNPESVQLLTQAGHDVAIESGAGIGIGAPDERYRNAGACIVADADSVFSDSDMIVKVKEPQKNEWEKLTAQHILFTYLHLAPDPDQAVGLMESGCAAIAYETVTDADGRLPLLTPMSAVAGRMAPQMASFYAQAHCGGSGLLSCGVEGVEPARILIVGGGVSGVNAAEIALGLGAHVTILEKSQARIAALKAQFPAAHVLESTPESVEAESLRAHIIIGAVLIPGAAAPKIISRDLISRLTPGTVVVDIAIDQGGCIETSHATTHQDPIYLVDDVVHYCVANMPGAYPCTSTAALNAATMPYVMALADKGLQAALADDVHLAEGLNVYQGKITNKAVAEALNMPYNPSGFHGSSDL